MMIEFRNGKKLTDSDLAAIDHQVLIGIGSLDNIVSQEELMHATKLLQNVVFKIIQECKHPFEKGELSDIILDFINESN